jgi:hypothetical protein
MKLSTPRNAVALAISMAAAYGTQAYAATAAGTSITNQATATYVDSTATARSATSNTVITVVQQVASIGLSAGSAKNAAPGAQVTYAHSITNNGNGSDTFALASSNTGAYAMTGVVFYADANGDGIADNATPITTTGTLAPGAVFRRCRRHAACRRHEWIDQQPGRHRHQRLQRRHYCVCDRHHHRPDGGIDRHHRQLVRPGRTRRRSWRGSIGSDHQHDRRRHHHPLYDVPQ